MTEQTPKGRPPGKRYPKAKSIKLRDVDVERLEKLAEKFDRDQSWVVRYAVEMLAKGEGVD